MSANDVVLLQTALERHKERSTPQLRDAEHLTFFVAQHYLRDYNLSHEVLLAGVVEGERDCGLDAIYIFINGFCITDDAPVAGLGRCPRLDLVLIQSKNTRGFSEDAVDKLLVNLPRLLSFDRDEAALVNVANSRLIEITRRFLDVYRSLEMPELSIYVAFASAKATSVVPPEAKNADLQGLLLKLFGGCAPVVACLDAAAISDLMRQPASVTRKLQLAENPISTNTAGGYIGVVRLSDYRDFITAYAGELDTSLFEANVRDYEGETSVNESIQQTLSVADDPIDFWWLNNGVTIVAARVQPANKLLELEDPQIVNGLQTSTEIYKSGRVTDDDLDHRSVLVKVVEAGDPDVRDRIIRATNSQTAFGPSALKATDRVQRDIEEYLHDRGLYYERRRRQYFNEGRPVDKIVTIDSMGQAVLAVLLQAPHVARATPSRVFDKEIYDVVFQRAYPLAMYATSISLLRAATIAASRFAHLNPDDFRYHLAMLAAIMTSRTNQPAPKVVAELLGTELDSELATELVGWIQKEYDRFGRREGIVQLDQLAKNPKVTANLLNQARSYLLSSRRSSRH